MMHKPVSNRKGFTLIELLVVISIIAVLIGILLPALSAARRAGQAAKCGTSMRQIGQAMGCYLTDNGGIYPPAYIYPYDGNGNYDLTKQGDVDSHPFGYLHWSYFLYSGGQVSDDAFKCPSIATNGGHPRTNPGSREWESEQIDQNGQSGPNPLEDRQAPRIAFGGNAAIFPRNKFSQGMSADGTGGVRVNQCVNEKEINSGKTILAAEFNKNWKAISVNDGGGFLSKSHRPINAFTHIGSGANEYGAPVNVPGFTYGTAPYYGLLSGAEIEETPGLIGGSGGSELNAVGRHHPGGGGYVGGTANFVYADGHVEKKSVLQTIQTGDWGTRYYSINGNNKIGPPW
jgi:prepilin-type N-terminal cleavage/methylation domain-containing protein/prepilin-type processing-associated H-X9-DG protein